MKVTSNAYAETELSSDDPTVPTRSSAPWGHLYRSRGRILRIVILVVTFGYLLAPLVPTLLQSFLSGALYESDSVLTFQNYVNLFTKAGFSGTIVNTAIFVVGTVVISLAIAVPSAIAVVKINLPFARTFAVALQWPFFVSTLILGFGWIVMYGPAGFVSEWVRSVLGFVPWNLYSLPGMAITEAVGLAPVAFLFCANALRQADSSLESAAQICGAKPIRIIFRVILPMLRPAITYSSTLILTMSLATLSVPLLYGLPVRIEVFATFLYFNGVEALHPDNGLLGAASVLILVVMAAAMAVQFRLLRGAERFISVRGKATRSRPLALGWVRWVLLAFISIYAVFGAIVPIAGLIFRSFTSILSPLRNPLDFLTFENYSRIYTFYLRPIINSLIIASAGAIVITLIAILAVLTARRSDFKLRRAVEFASLAPLALPGIVIGIGFYWTFAIAPLGTRDWLNGTILGVLVAFGLLALPLAYSSLSPAVLQIEKELDAAARVSGLDWIGMIWRVLRGLIRPAIGTAVILVFVTLMKEYSAAIFLAGADSQVMGTAMLSLWYTGDSGAVAAMVTIQLFVTTIVVMLLSWIFRRRSSA